MYFYLYFVQPIYVHFKDLGLSVITSYAYRLHILVNYTCYPVLQCNGHSNQFWSCIFLLDIRIINSRFSSSATFAHCTYARWNNLWQQNNKNVKPDVKSPTQYYLSCYLTCDIMHSGKCNETGAILSWLKCILILSYWNLTRHVHFQFQLGWGPALHVCNARYSYDHF